MAIQFALNRFFAMPQKGTFGVLSVFENYVAVARYYTIEQFYRSNTPFQSCVPLGRYKVHKHLSPKYGITLLLENHVLGVGRYQGDSIRWGCLVHVANVQNDVKGCIGPGMDLGVVYNTWGVTSSGDAMDSLTKWINKLEGISELEIDFNPNAYQLMSK